MLRTNSDTFGRCSRIFLAMAISGVALMGCGNPEVEGLEDGSAARAARPSGDTVPPSAPSGLSGRAVSPSEIDLNWNASSDNVAVQGYRVYRNGTLLVTLGDVTEYKNTGLTASTTYSYTVQAIDTAGNASAQSWAVIVTTPATVDTTPPLPPTTLTANAVSSSQINLIWSGATDNVAVTGYRVFRNGVLLVTLGNVTTYQDTLLLSGVTYIYTIRAVDAQGNISGLSPAASATTSTAPPDTTPPTTPLGLRASGTSPSQINLTWVASTDNVAVTGYRVFRDGAILVYLGNVTSYVDSGLAAATVYSYNVDAFDAVGNFSGLSVPANAATLALPDTTPPSTPTGLTANAVTFSQINLNWFASTDNLAVTGYRVFRNGVLLTTLGNVTTYQDVGLAESTTYTYRVRALDAAGNVSNQSNAASATTPAIPDTIAPTIPAGLVASAVSSSRIDLSWTASTDNVAVTGYRVYQNGLFLAALGNVTTFQSTGLLGSTTYTYNVDAIDAAGNASGVSPAAVATTLASNTATLEWDPVGGAIGYRIYYGVTKGGPYPQVIDVGDVTTHTVTGLGAATRYYFVATAYDAVTEGAYSNEVFKDIP